MSGIAPGSLRAVHPSRYSQKTNTVDKQKSSIFDSIDAESARNEQPSQALIIIPSRARTIAVLADLEKRKARKMSGSNSGASDGSNPTSPGTIFDEDRAMYDASLNAKHLCRRFLTGDEATLVNGDAVLGNTAGQRNREHLLEDSAASQHGFVVNGRIDPDALLQLFQAHRSGGGSSQDRRQRDVPVDKV